MLHTSKCRLSEDVSHGKLLLLLAEQLVVVVHAGSIEDSAGLRHCGRIVSVDRYCQVMQDFGSL